MAAWGSSTILIESGGWRDDPQKQHLRKTNFVGILSALDAIATGRYADYDPAVYDNLEFNGRSVPDLLVAGGTLAVPGAPTLAADILIRYDRPLLRRAAGSSTSATWVKPKRRTRCGSTGSTSFLYPRRWTKTAD